MMQQKNTRKAYNFNFFSVPTTMQMEYSSKRKKKKQRKEQKRRDLRNLRESIQYIMQKINKL